MLIEGLVEATRKAAQALSLCRIADTKGTLHEKPCSETTPCRGCELDSYAVATAVIASLEGHIADMLAVG